MVDLILGKIFEDLKYFTVFSSHSLPYEVGL